jgi:large subunit ribosomal protein L25
MKVVATERSLQGTSASRRLRHTGKVPGVVYGAGQPAQMIELDHNNLIHALQKEKFHSSILDVEVGGKAFIALLRDFQMHPYKRQVMHIDFQRVDPSAPLHMKVPFHFVGAENSQAVKFDKQMINQVVHEIEIACLPKDLPEFIEVDLSSMKKGSSIHLNEVKLPQGVSFVSHGKGNPAIATTVSIGGADDEPKAADAAAAPAAAPAKGAKPAADAKAAPAKAPAKK